MKIRKSKMKKFVLETLDFTSIFKGYRIPIPFFLLCIDINNIEKQKNEMVLWIAETIDFTGLKGTFEEKNMFSYMVYNEKL